MTHQLETVPLDALMVDPANARRHDARNLEAIRASLRRFGQQHPIIADRDNVVVAGNGRLEAMRLEGWSECSVVYTDLEGADRTAFAIADNRTAELAAWEEDILRQTIESLDDELREAAGFLDAELEVLLKDHREPGEAPAARVDQAAELRDKWECERGQLWQIGRHRLMCGDSTSAEDVARLLTGELVESVVTDPPYGMSYKGERFGCDGISNDGEDEFEAVLQQAVECALAIAPEAIWALCFGTSRLDAYFRATGSLRFHRLLTIYKPNRMAHPWRGWILTSEVIGLFSTGNPEWGGDGEHCHDVYTFDYTDRPGEKVDHPTVKPLAIIGDVMRKIGGGSVYEPFAGSGTTLVAAEQLSRTCYGMEIEPKYCAVILERLSDMGLEPVLVDNDGADLLG